MALRAKDIPAIPFTQAQKTGYKTFVNRKVEYLEATIGRYKTCSSLDCCFVVAAYLLELSNRLGFTTRLFNDTVTPWTVRQCNEDVMIFVDPKSDAVDAAVHHCEFIIILMPGVQK